MPLEDADYGRLVSDVNNSLREMLPYRESFRKAVAAYAGDQWASGPVEKTPLNALDLWVTIVIRSLVSHHPQFLASTFEEEHEWVASVLEQYGNDRIEATEFGAVLEEACLHGLFGLVAIKVALGTAGDVDAEAFYREAGEEFSQVVHFDDLVLDMSARRLSAQRYYGHRFRISRRVAIAMWGEKAKLIPVAERYMTNTGGDERLDQLGVEHLGSDAEFEDMVECWEIYLPHHNELVVFGGDSVGPHETQGPVNKRKWIGPKSGPLHFLSLGSGVPGSLISKAPVMNLVNLNRDMNDAYNKALRMVARLKETLLVRAGTDETEIEAIRNSPDGEVIPVKDVDAYKNVVWSGEAIQLVLGVATQLKDVFNFMAGNIAVQGGLSAEAGTAKQEQLLNANSSATVAAMQAKTVKFTTKVLTAKAWFWHHDPFVTQQVTFQLPGAPDIKMPRQASPDDRAKVPFDKLRLSIEPYSLQGDTPQGKLAAVTQFMQQNVLPLLQLLQAQGIGIDMNEFVRLAAKWMNIPELLKCIRVQQPLQASPGGDGGGDAPGMPMATQREYIRTNRSERTGSGTDQQVAAQLLGAKLGGAQETAGAA